VLRALLEQGGLPIDATLFGPGNPAAVRKV